VVLEEQALPWYGLASRQGLSASRSGASVLVLGIERLDSAFELNSAFELDNILEDLTS
jgi:hypothetical protein